MAAGGRPDSGDNPKAGPTFTQESGVWQVDRTTVVLKNTVTDPDGDTANLTFEVYSVDANGDPKDQVDISDTNPYDVIVSDYVPSGESVEVTVPYGRLKPGTTYIFHTSAYDGDLYETEWSPWAKFRIRDRAVDITLPAPQKKAPAPDFDTSWQPVPGWTSVDTNKRSQGSKRHCEPAKNGGQLCITSAPATKAEIIAAKESQARVRTTSTPT